MRCKTLLPLFFVAILLVSCEFKCEVGNSTANEEENNKYKPVEKDVALLYNGIQLATNNVKVEKAYLVTDDDSGERIGEGNFIDIAKGVKLVLLVEDGWKEIGDHVWLGASLAVVTNEGETLLNNPDLFKEYDQAGIKSKDARALSLSVYFSSWKSRGPISIHVSFRVWDKRSDGFIQGSYVVHTK